MAARVWTKPETQQFLRQLRKAGYRVVKRDHMTYQAFSGETKVFTALKFSWGYAVTIKEEIIA